VPVNDQTFRESGLGGEGSFSVHVTSVRSFYRLYGLSDEERAIVEGRTNNEEKESTSLAT